jgi:hypothetical protein
MLCRKYVYFYPQSGVNGRGRLNSKRRRLDVMDSKMLDKSLERLYIDFFRNGFGSNYSPS